MKTVLDYTGFENYAPLDETEAINVSITDDMLRAAKIAAYNVGQVVSKDDNDGKGPKEVPFNPKKFPTKAIDILIQLEGLRIELFFEPTQCKWDSDVVINGQHVKLSPDQMGTFFRTEFYNRLLQKLGKNWPLSDKFYGKLFTGLTQREMLVGDGPQIQEAGNDHRLSNKDVDGDKVRDYTPSGRRIISFSDSLVSTKDAKFYCWPDLKKVFRWSTWKDWEKIKPLCRMRFMHNGIPYGLSLSTLGEDEDYRNRGFRGYSLDPSLPPVQWLTKEENESLMNLKLVDKFIRHCAAKISKYVKLDPQEIMSKVNNPENLNTTEIAKTQACIRKTLAYVIKEKQIDSFKWKS